MAHHFIVALCVVIGISSSVNAQWWNMGQTSMSRFGGMMGNVQDINEYQTCIGLNSDGDEMRVTFTSETSNNPWGGNWGSQWGNTENVRLSAVIASSQQSTLQGQFQLVVTEGSRTEEGCSSRALGDILTDRSWWSRAATSRGVIQTPILIMQGQTATYSEPMTTLTFQEMTGRGLALCPSQQISRGTCLGVIPLCCKIGYDSQPATTPFTSQNQFLAQGALGAPSNGGMNGMNGGMQGLNPPMNGGMSQGLPSGMNNGLGQGNNAQGTMGGSQGMGGLAF
ncbi:uncharacterized protein [Haliotis cracherodii]|uniref:uncharacterized protein n=1 Tax=Haliotis cracherodii TaxID=6455 RepID=UPI0039EA7BC4